MNDEQTVPMMKNKKTIILLGFIIAILSAVAAATGIFHKEGSGNYEYLSIRNETVTIYGQGLYRHMSADVAIQGIAQDYITLFIAIPMLLVALLLLRKETLKRIFLLAGVLNYFFVTYLFYMNMAMYNALFIVYILLTSSTFFAFALTLIGINIKSLPHHFNAHTPVKYIGGFLIFLSSSIALLWLKTVLNPLFDGTIIPRATEHYTTLTVQGFDLSIFLPIAFLSGVLLIKKNPFGYFMGTITLVFLCFMMTALVAKIIAMANAGISVVPVVFIIPAFLVLTVFSTVLLFKNIKNEIE